MGNPAGWKPNEKLFWLLGIMFLIKMRYFLIVEMHDTKVYHKGLDLYDILLIWQVNTSHESQAMW